MNTNLTSALKLTEKLKLIDRAFLALEPLDDISWQKYRLELFALCLLDEKQHRTSDFDRMHPNAFTTRAAARMFTVHLIAGFMTGRKVPETKDYISTKGSHFYAASVALTYREEILTAWKDFPIQELAALNYLEFIN